MSTLVDVKSFIGMLHRVEYYSPFIGQWRIWTVGTDEDEVRQKARECVECMPGRKVRLVSQKIEEIA